MTLPALRDEFLSDSFGQSRKIDFIKKIQIQQQQQNTFAILLSSGPCCAKTPRYVVFDLSTTGVVIIRPTT